MEAENRRASTKFSAFFDLLGLVGFALAAPTALLLCGIRGPASFLEKSLGAFGSPPALLLAFLALAFLRAVFGTCRRALPVLSGLLVGLACFAAVFDLPRLGALRAALSRFPAFAHAGPAFFAGLAATALGSILGQFEGKRPLRAFLAPLPAALAVLVVLAGLKPFPPLAPAALSVESALRGISATLGYRYRNPEVEREVRKVLEDQAKSVAEKEKTIAELTARLKKAEEDRLALEKAAGDARRLGKELEAAKAALADLRSKAESSAPMLEGGDYDGAVQPTDPLVRDFAVGVAKSAPGAFDRPQGSRRPTAEGLRQVALVHGALSSSWAYVSDPGVKWTDYVSPARRTIALGLAGDCDDFAVVVASCAAAIGGRVRIMHGYDSKGGHAWAELWLGRGTDAAAALAELSRLLGRPAAAIAVDRDGRGDSWLVLDWRLGELSINASRLEIGWTGES
ncbi:MAG: hypothetical protein JNG85_05570 [Spirochaetaceae bacterium]|nr:hypothetical protein [Spirochaetaceae bacterium]